jgi:hypothetical protein
MMQGGARLAVSLATILLSGCGSQLPPPAVEIRTVTKTVEVQRPCPVTRPARPAPLARPLPTDAVALAALLGSKLLEYSGAGGFADRADAAIRQCTTP